MRESLDNQVAASLETTPALMVHLPALLADCWGLGCCVQTVLEMLGALDLPAGARVLDLACGKGELSIRAAAALGCRVEGVDGFEPFLDEARRRANEWGVADRCHFLRADIRDIEGGEFDVAVFSSVGPVIDGRPCVERLRRCVRPGGHMIIDDGFLVDGVEDLPPGYEFQAPYDRTITRMTAQGDAIIREVVQSWDDLSDDDERMYAAIARRAEALVADHPQDAGLIRGYVARQRRECDLLRSIHVPATWLLRRS